MFAEERIRIPGKEHVRMLSTGMESIMLWNYLEACGMVNISLVEGRRDSIEYLLGVNITLSVKKMKLKERG